MVTKSCPNLSGIRFSDSYCYVLFPDLTLLGSLKKLRKVELEVNIETHSYTRAKKLEELLDSCGKLNYILYKSGNRIGHHELCSKCPQIVR